MKIKVMVLLLMVFFAGTPKLFADGQGKDSSVANEPIAQFEDDTYQLIKYQNRSLSEAEVQQALGFALMDYNDHWQRAVVHFKKAAALNPKLYKSWYMLGLIYMDKEAGNKYLRKAIQVNPDYDPSYYWLANKLCRNRKDKEAIQIFETYLKVASKNGNADPDKIEEAKELLKELRSGKEGKELKIVRME